ncbi:MAG: FAD-dependent oxidoreductase [Proteobacteria bacterium]|nr:FAD-dependent oxidoreductase [Pseudomonadota bacterium]
MTDTGIVIIGAGQAGGEAAYALREGGFAGPVTIIGDEPYIPYERPPLSKALLIGDAEPADTYLREQSIYDERDIGLRLDTAVASIDRSGKGIELADGSGLAYDTLLVATGARVRRLDLPGGDLEGVFYLRDIADSLAIRAALKPGAHLVVIGGGYVGLEVAASARKRGCAAVVVEVADRIMNRVVAPEMSAHFTDVHTAAGVEIRTNTMTDAIEGNGRVREILLSDGSRVAADLVVIGVGVVPNAEIAERAGLVVDNGVKVDAFTRTDDPNIFAAGDVTNHFNPLLGRSLRLESWQNAQNQSIAAAQIMLGGEEPHAEIPWFWSDQYDINLQMVGAPESWDQVVRRDGGEAGRFTLFYLAGDKLVAANTVDNARDIRPSRQLIASGAPVTADELADPDVKMQQLVKR